MTQEPQYITLTQAAQYLDMSVWKVKRLYDAGVLSGTRSARGDRMVHLSSVQAHLAAPKTLRERA